MRKDHAVKEVDPPAERVFQSAPNQRAAVRLEVRFGQTDLLPGAEEAHRVGPGSQDDLLRRIGTVGSDDFSAAFRLESFHITIRILENLTALFQLLHRWGLLVRNEKSGRLFIRCFPVSFPRPDAFSIRFFYYHKTSLAMPVSASAGKEDRPVCNTSGFAQYASSSPSIVRSAVRHPDIFFRCSIDNTIETILWGLQDKSSLSPAKPITAGKR